MRINLDLLVDIRKFFGYIQSIFPYYSSAYLSAHSVV
jgi:hypothetical protein